jgi:actin-related protein
MYPNLPQRLEAEIRGLVPPATPVKVGASPATRAGA